MDKSHIAIFITNLMVLQYLPGVMEAGFMCRIQKAAVMEVLVRSTSIHKEKL